MTGIELAVEYPALATRPFVVNEAAPEGAPVRGGVVVDVPIDRLPNGTVLVSAGLRGWGAGWDRAPAFVATVWNADVDVGYRVEGWEDGPVSAWWGLGGGSRVGLLAADYWQDVLSFGLGAWTGGGVAFGAGPVRPTLSARASVTLDLDTWSGSVMAHETTTWTYWPGNARVGVLAGVAFR